MVWWLRLLGVKADQNLISSTQIVKTEPTLSGCPSGCPSGTSGAEVKIHHNTGHKDMTERCRRAPVGSLVRKYRAQV